jgi:hypothetical protein
MFKFVKLSLRLHEGCYLLLASSVSRAPLFERTCVKVAPTFSSTAQHYSTVAMAELVVSVVQLHALRILCIVTISCVD